MREYLWQQHQNRTKFKKNTARLSLPVCFLGSLPERDGAPESGGQGQRQQPTLIHDRTLSDQNYAPKMYKVHK